MKKFFQDFKTFISRGNVMNLAVGVIIGGAFQKIVSSLVNDIIMPLIGAIGRVNIKEAMAVLVPEQVNAAGEVTKAAVILQYGNFIQTIIDFLIIALAIFIAMKVIMRLTLGAEESKNRREAKKRAKAGLPEPKPEPVLEPVKPNNEVLLEEIRDLLKEKK